MPILQINRQPAGGISIGRDRFYPVLMHASVISEVVMQIRMEKFPGVKLERE